MKTFVNTANKGTLNLRAEPSSSAKVLARIPYGTELEVESINSEWSKTKYESHTGYVMNKFLAEKTNQIKKEDLQRIYNSLKSTLSTIESILK